MVTAERVIPVRTFKATHCPQGHEFTTANTKLDRNGYRKCRTCDRLAAKRHAQRYRQSESTVWPVVYTLDNYESAYSAKEKLSCLRRRFSVRMGHGPSLIVGSKAMIAELEAVLGANPRWESCTLRVDETIVDDCLCRMR